MTTYRDLTAIMRHDSDVMGHEFIQDPEDIPGGCLTCWSHLDGIDAD